jgi:hypothetical protein
VRKSGPIPYLYKGAYATTDWGKPKKKCQHKFKGQPWTYAEYPDMGRVIYVRWRTCRCGREDRHQQNKPWN